jgi:hypothetical protein
MFCGVMLKLDRWMCLTSNNKIRMVNQIQKILDLHVELYYQEL